MAQTVERFKQVTVNLAELSMLDGVELFVNDANTRRIIKDVSINYGSDDAFNIGLEVDGHNIGTFTDSASGDEIIGPNSTVKLKNDAPFLDVDFQVMKSGATWEYLTGEYEKAGDFVISSEEATFDIAGTITASTYMFFIADPTNTYYIYGSWDGNSSSNLAKRLVLNGGVQGTHNISSYSCLPCYGGDNYVYWMDSNICYRTRIDDANGQEVFATGVNGYPNTTAPMFATNAHPSSDGKRCLVTCQSNSGTIYANFQDQVSGADLSNVSMQYPNNNFWGDWDYGVYALPFYCESRSVWMLIYCNGAGMRIAEIPASAGYPFLIAENTSYGSFPQVTTSPDGSSIFVVNDSRGGIDILDLELNVVGELLSDNALVSATYNKQRPILGLVSPTEIEISGRDYSNAPNASVRVTGIQSISEGV